MLEETTVSINHRHGKYVYSKVEFKYEQDDKEWEMHAIDWSLDLPKSNYYNKTLYIYLVKKEKKSSGVKGCILCR